MTVRDRVSKLRGRPRSCGLRPILVWVPDVRSASFADEARRQALAVAQVSAQSDDQVFAEAITIPWDE